MNLSPALAKRTQMQDSQTKQSKFQKILSTQSNKRRHSRTEGRLKQKSRNQSK